MVAPNTRLDGVRQALGICGCNADLIDAIMDEDISAMNNLGILTGKILETLVKTISSLPADRGGCKMGITKIKKVQGLCNWCKMRRASLLPPDTNIWDNAALTRLLQELELEDARNNDEHERKLLSKLDALTWVSWERSMRNYLSQLPLQVTGVPLEYVIRKLIPLNYFLSMKTNTTSTVFPYRALGFSRTTRNYS